MYLVEFSKVVLKSPWTRGESRQDRSHFWARLLLVLDSVNKGGGVKRLGCRLNGVLSQLLEGGAVKAGYFFYPSGPRDGQTVVILDDAATETTAIMFFFLTGWSPLSTMFFGFFADFVILEFLLLFMFLPSLTPPQDAGLKVFSCVCQVGDEVVYRSHVEILLQDTVQRILRGLESRLKWLVRLNWWPGRFFILNFKGTPSHEEHKTIFNGWKIYEVALSDQIDFPAFFRFRKMTYQNFIYFRVQQFAGAMPLTRKLALHHLVEENWFSGIGRLRKLNASVTGNIADCVTLTKQSQLSLLKPVKMVSCYSCDCVPLKFKEKNGRASSLPARIIWA